MIPVCTPQHHWWILAIIILTFVRSFLIITFKWTNWQWEMKLADAIQTIVSDWILWFRKK